MVNNLKEKAQISIEFIIMIAIFLLFFYSMILPSISFSEKVVEDTYKLVQTKDNVTYLANFIEDMSNTPGYGKREIFFYMPDGVYISNCDNTVNPKILTAKVKVNSMNAVNTFCDSNGDCDINVPVYTNLTINCNDVLASGYRGLLTVEKTNSGVISFYE